MDLSKALAVKPDDAHAALESLEEQGLVRCDASNGFYELTDRGKSEIACSIAELDGFFGLCAGALSDEDRKVLAGLVRSALLVPGGSTRAWRPSIARVRNLGRGIAYWHMRRSSMSLRRR